MRKGLDYSWGRPNLQQMKAAGYDFAMRYLSPYIGSGKNTGLDEVRTLHSNGIALGLVFESYVGRPLEGQAAGVADAKTALANARAVGFPDNRPIYFAVDFDAYEHQQDEIDAYLRGVAEVIGVDRVGVYGGYWVVKRCKENGSAKWFWQTYAWSGGNKLQGLHLYQHLNGQRIGGADVDFNEAYGDAGLWEPDGSQPAPIIVLASSVKTGSLYTVVSGDTLSSIAARYGTTWQELARINNLSNPNLIIVGQQIRLAGSSVPATFRAISGDYTVVPGDTLSAIASRFGTTYQELARINSIADPDKIYPGQVIRTGGASAPTPAPVSTSARTYTVVSGDNLSGIAAKFGTSWQALQQINNIPNANLIYPGQVLRVG